MARLPKFLNIPVLRRMRLELPAAKTALIAFSATMVVVGVGVFLATLPGLTVAEIPLIGELVAKTDDAATDEAVEAATSADAAVTAATDQAASAGTSSVAAGATSSHSTRSGATSATSAGSGGGSSAGSAGGSSGSADSGSSSGSSSGGSSSSSEPDNDAANANNPFIAIPTEAEEQEYHAFLCSWYNQLDACEAQAREGDSSGCWEGYLAVRDRVHSNYSQWCDAYGKLVAAFRCLGSWAESGEQTYYDQYQSYRAAVNL